MICVLDMVGMGIKRNCLFQIEICTRPVHVTYSNRKPGDLWETFD